MKFEIVMFIFILAIWAWPHMCKIQNIIYKLFFTQFRPIASILSSTATGISFILIDF